MCVMFQVINPEAGGGGKSIRQVREDRDALVPNPASENKIMRGFVNDDVQRVVRKGAQEPSHQKTQPPIAQPQPAEHPREPYLQEEYRQENRRRPWVTTTQSLNLRVRSQDILRPVRMRLV